MKRDNSIKPQFCGVTLNIKPVALDYLSWQRVGIITVIKRRFSGFLLYKPAIK